MAQTTRSTTTDDKDWRQYLALAIGAVYVLVGIAGFFVTGFDGFAAEEGDTLLGFELNPLHNIVHLVIGAAGLAAWARRDLTRAYGIALVVGYGATFVYGLFAVNAEWDFLAINNADNGLHLFSAIAGAVVATVPIGAAARARGSRGRTQPA